MFIIFCLPIVIVAGVFIFSLTMLVRQVISKWKTLDERHKSYAITLVICDLIIAIGFTNFVSFFLISVALGGNALKGKQVGEKYYLVSHSKITEVSQATWNYSRYHTISVIVTHPLAICAMIVAGFAKRIFGIKKCPFGCDMEFKKRGNEDNNSNE
jgi:hypothetical protein